MSLADLLYLSWAMFLLGLPASPEQTTSNPL
jgi:hypothetical protein